MNEKCNSTSPTAIQVKKSVKELSTDEKLYVISQTETGEQIVDIWHNV